MPVTRIDIRMIPASQLPKGALDLSPRSRSADLENHIQIFATCHDSAVSPCGDLEILLFFLLLIRVDVLGVDDVIRLSAGRAGAVTGGTSLAAAGLRA